MKLYNFNAGPSILPDIALKRTADAINDLDKSGLSLLEISHRSSEFEAIFSEAESLLRELLNVPFGYKVLFLGGGASTQFFVAPYNLLDQKAVYLETGAWAKKAIEEAAHFGDVDVIASSADKNYSYIPKGYEIPKNADYFHITTNNTIFGTELHTDIDSPIPLVADMSSDILSRPVDISKYALIYGGAQKNMGPAGVSFVIIREDVLGSVKRRIPKMIDYRTHIEHNSLYNTPPVASIYTLREVLKWVKDSGGVPEMYKRNKAKAKLLYDEIDSNKLFEGTAKKEDRSLMNVCFVMNKKFEKLDNAFHDSTIEQGMIGLKGHRSVGGFRASIYNAMPLGSVKALVDCMKKFEKENS